MRVEKALHQYLARWRNKGEWFLIRPDDAEASEAYEHGVGAVLSMELCRGAWEYVEIDWAAYEMDKQASASQFRRTPGAVAKAAARKRRNGMVRRELFSTPQKL